MIRILFTRHNHWLSRAMCRVLCEPVSHCAVQVGRLVIHSTWRGVHAQSLESFQSNNEIVSYVDLPIQRPYARHILARYGDAGYDWWAYAWLAVNIAARRAGVPLPKVNLWQVSGMYLCTEFVTELVDGEADSMITPYRLYRRLTNV